MLRRAPYVLLASVVLMSEAWAQTTSTITPNVSPALTGATRVDPRIITLFAHRVRTGETYPAFERSPDFESTGYLPVVMRFQSSPPDSALLAALSREGVVWNSRRGPLASGGWDAQINERALAAIERTTEVTHIEVDLHPRHIATDQLSLTETQTQAARRALRLRDGTELDGRGTIIADLDTGVYVFHPTFFRADGGMFRWIDKDQNNVFNPGTDGIDLDRDGSIAENEVVQVFSATGTDRYGLPLQLPGGRRFNARRDWLYIDTDGNGRRDAGSGFEESVPGYGEPTFVVDDANLNGMIDTTEHVLRLGSSKVIAVNSRSVWRRGDPQNPLSQYDPIGGGGNISEVDHGTAVAGIMVGGIFEQSLIQGLAPAAELLIADVHTGRTSGGDTTLAQWALDEHADVILTEFGQYNSVALDGSSEFEQLLDAAFDRGTVTVSPAGNLSEGFKHRSVTLMPGENNIPVVANDGFNGAEFIQISIYYRSAVRTLSVKIATPTIPEFTLPDSVPQGMNVSGGAAVYVDHARTTRGTEQRFIGVSRRGGFGQGTFTLKIVLGETEPLPVEVFVGDNVTGWGGGFSLEQNTSEKTLCYPATSDKTIAVAAYTLHDAPEYSPWGNAGERAGYSSQGPRIDGEPAIDIASPDNPLAPQPDTLDGTAPARFTPFGGTSGAGPHVAAAVALLKQRFPAETPTQRRDRLLSHLRNDVNAPTTTPTLTGRGKLDVAAALEVTSPSTTTVPTARLTAPAEVKIASPYVVSLVAVGKSPIKVRWDTDYDGTYDTQWAALATASEKTLTDTVAGPHDVKVQTMDGDGIITGATARIMVVTQLTTPDAGGEIPSVTGPGCGCSVPTRETRCPGPWLVLGLAAVCVRRRTPWSQ